MGSGNPRRLTELMTAFSYVNYQRPAIDWMTPSASGTLVTKGTAGSAASSRSYDVPVMLTDPLLENDIEVSRRDAPTKKLAQALDLMETGIRLKRAVLGHAQKEASSQQLDEALLRWLCSDG